MLITRLLVILSYKSPSGAVLWLQQTPQDIFLAPSGRHLSLDICIRNFFQIVINIFFFYLPIHRENLKMFMYYPAGVISFIVLFRFAINIIPRWGIYYSCFEFNPLKMSPRWGLFALPYLFHITKITARWA
jgi:hypothetical protein